ncbi:MAG: hypothetical protein AAGF77_04710 [Bacteroidota bacterium]
MAMLCLGGIALQDFKERQVYGFLFPVLAIILGYAHVLVGPSWAVTALQMALNMLLVTLVVTIAYGYTKFLKKQAFLNHSLGLGDILFFGAMAVGFPSTVFLVLFTGALLFSLLVFWALRAHFKDGTIPLAGLMGLFLIAVLGVSLLFKQPLLYTL